MWSTIGEGIGLFLASNIVINLHRPDLLLPSMALVVGLHFLPIALATHLRPFSVLGAALLSRQSPASSSERLKVVASWSDSWLLARFG